MESPCKTTRSRTEDDVLLQVGRGLGRASTLASDEAKAMMETKAAVEMAYMIKQRLLLYWRGAALHFIPARSPS